MKTRARRIASIAILTITAGTALAGCNWNSYSVRAGVNPQGNTFRNSEAVLTQDTSNKAILNCTRFYPHDRSGTSRCVLDVVRDLCRRTDTEFDALCYPATDHSMTTSIYNAIYAPVGVLGNAECLAYERDQVYDGISGGLVFENKYWTAENRGSFGCPNATG